MWSTKSFNEAYKRLAKKYGDRWNDFDQEKREAFALRETKLAELQAAKVRQYTNGAQVLDALKKRYDAGNDYFDHNKYTFNDIIACKVRKICKRKEYMGINHSEYLPVADEFISDERVLQQVKDLLPNNKAVQQCKDLQSLADVLYREKPTVELVSFQSASDSGWNVVTTGNFGKADETIITAGPFQVPANALYEYARKYPNYCSIKDGVFSITNMEKFGEEALSGVPLNKASGAYVIETDVPINGLNISFPSVCNNSSYQAFFVPGGKLLSGGTEMTICPLKDIINIGTVIDENGITGLDLATGIKFSIKKLEE